eukprot:CAMPEP_0194433348 /NCGR_PEP_ID=MMETSP0176-20130528/76184_1 /TAXON_ID=216777 /ORGANISM="Proboscia alata, Strain PI-D3" /LENGTH=404 /DNA_ID=CAMNT_0039250485 /DNA_START=11 /DNA_END=1225 /DNA_ORIENTATION=+
MKVCVHLFIALTTCLCAAATTSFNANSKAGKGLLSKASKTEQSFEELMSSSSSSSFPQRKLEDAFEESFVASHSIIYEGCHNASSWEDDGYRKISLVRFKLCPSAYCSSSGCSSDYAGEYVVDLMTFVDAYLESKMEAKEYQCEMMREKCGCDDDADDDYCGYYCYNDYGFDYSECREEGDEDGEEENYGECRQFEWEDDDDDNNDDAGRRRLGQDDDEEEIEMFMGPYCKNGVDIRLNLFSDEDCSIEYPGGGGKLYKSITGSVLPFYSSSVVERECISCLEPEDENDQNDDDAEDEDEVIKFCEETYESAAKCEENMTNSYPDTSGCNIISKLKTSTPSGYSISASVVEVLSSRNTNNFQTLVACFLGVCIIGGVLIGITKMSKGAPKKKLSSMKEQQPSVI